jgi:capsid protein
VAEGGGDIEDLLTARAAEVDRAEQLGLQFDTNPADDQLAGATNATPEQEITNEENV